eukprot:TRINITY_DN2159_c0_g1_i1.p1 TRINITY_DN2159_c0_g1~~TRINITY_DN2159_c0_g1_i1.p1  ORF type:complete len:532 (-),score=43.72 TRINITY_DN2159_c0_g1_i1:34-1629(-)
MWRLRMYSMRFAFVLFFVCNFCHLSLCQTYTPQALLPGGTVNGVIPPFAEDNVYTTPVSYYVDVPRNVQSWTLSIVKPTADSDACSAYDYTFFRGTLVPPCLPPSDPSQIGKYCSRNVQTTPLTGPQTITFGQSSDSVFAHQRLFFGVGKTDVSQAPLNCTFSMSVSYTQCSSPTAMVLVDASLNTFCAEIPTVANDSVTPTNFASYQDTSLTGVEIIFPDYAASAVVSFTANTDALAVYGALTYMPNIYFNDATITTTSKANSDGTYTFSFTVSNPQAGPYYYQLYDENGGSFTGQAILTAFLCNGTSGGAGCASNVTALPPTTTLLSNITATSGSISLYQVDLGDVTSFDVTISPIGGSMVTRLGRSKYPTTSDLSATIADGGNFTWTFAASASFAGGHYFISVENGGTGNRMYTVNAVANATIPGFTGSSSTSSSLSSIPSFQSSSTSSSDSLSSSLSSMPSSSSTSSSSSSSSTTSSSSSRRSSSLSSSQSSRGTVVSEDFISSEGSSTRTTLIGMLCILATMSINF